jgi:hypothetical protein
MKWRPKDQSSIDKSSFQTTASTNSRLKNEVIYAASTQGFRDNGSGNLSQLSFLKRNHIASMIGDKPTNRSSPCRAIQTFWVPVKQAYIHCKQRLEADFRP